MPVCVSCGESFDENDRYCPTCGSPTKINIKNLETTTPDTKGHGRRVFIGICVFLFLLLLLVLSLYISSKMSDQMNLLSSGIY